MGRVLALGLDAVDELDVRARLAAGSMPHLAALRDRGTWCSFAVDALCRAEGTWPMFVTGLEPSRHGRFTPVTFDPANYQDGVLGAGDVQPFWSLVEDATVVVLDVPRSVPADPSRGVQIIDWSGHDAGYPRCSSPPGLLSELDARFGENPARSLEYAGTWNDAAWLRRYGAALVTSVQLRTRLIEHLLEATPDWALAIVVYSEPHQVGHHAWHGVAPESVLHGAPTAPVARKVLDDLYRTLDDAIGRLAGALGPDDAFVVFSPKGHEAISDLQSSTLVPELLHRQAFGEALLRQPSIRRWERRGRPPVVPPAGVGHARALQGVARAGPGARRGARARVAVQLHVSRGAGFLAPDLVARVRLWRRLRSYREAIDADPSAFDRAMPYDAWYPATWYRPWWPQMRAFVLPSFSDLHVRVNVAGRERDGIVSVADYPAACAEVERTLRACRNPRTGHGIVRSVERTRGADPFADAGLPADVVVSWAEDTDVLEHPDVGFVGPYPAWRAGGHSAHGFAVVAGPGVGSGEIAGPRLVDLPATILELVGVAPRSSIDGKSFVPAGHESVVG